MTLDQERFPTNREQYTVHSSIKKWLYFSPNILIITGYAGLAKVIDLISSVSIEDQKVRILLGNEPLVHSHHRTLKTTSEEMREYWLKRGLSINQCPQIEIAVRRLRNHEIHVRMPQANSRSVHAKIYCADTHVMMGSSNFSHSGFHQQIEGNSAYSKSKEKSRFLDTWELAEFIWNIGENCNEWLADLIEQLMQVVTWQEALARACHEILSGEWVDQLLRLEQEQEDLWPSQKDGIGQALYILDSTGAVLIADATGSGKTRMGAFLIQAISARSYTAGKRVDLCGIIAPPGVINNWEDETNRGGPNTRVHSSGLLGRIQGDKDKTERIESLLEKADILVIDEAHNYHNLKSNRSQMLISSRASHLLLFTATPINRSAKDLLVMVNLLGADNLHPNTIKEVEQYLGGRKKLSQLPDEVVSRLSSEVMRFTVRRTIEQLKYYIKQEPHLYRNAQGDKCCYPDIVNQVYSLNEPERDCAIALEIAQLASTLKGLNYLRTPIQYELDLENVNTSTLQQFVKWRVESARYIAAYRVMIGLRSSKFVLLEQLCGMDVAYQAAGLDMKHKKRSKSSGLIDQIQQYHDRPEQVLDPTYFPDFLVDDDAYTQALNNEVSIYERIVELTHQISTYREQSKVNQIIEAAKKHTKLLVFEERITALNVINKYLTEISTTHEVIMAIGTDAHAKSKVKSIMRLNGHDKGKYIALCSDAMSEGVNLQSASCLIMLDLPSVIRKAEQRIGRIERLDSPHQQVEVLWAKDNEAFRLRRDDKFVHRHLDTKRLIGANLQLPEEFAELDEVLSAESDAHNYLHLLKDNRQEELMVHDAFHPVYSLLEGDDALIDATISSSMKHISGMVISRVSLVESMSESWAFLCLAGSSSRPARWILIRDEAENSTAQLDEIALFLRQNLTAATCSLKPTSASTTAMSCLIEQFAQHPEIELSRKRKAILTLLRKYAVLMMKQSGQVRAQEQLDYYHRIYSLLPGSESQLLDDDYQVNSEQLVGLADGFEDLIRPLRNKRLKRDGRRKLIKHRDLYSDLKHQPLPFDEFKKSLDQALNLPADEVKIAAAIFGLQV